MGSTATRQRIALLATATMMSLLGGALVATPAAAADTQPSSSCGEPQVLNPESQNELYELLENKDFQSRIQELFCSSTAGSTPKPGGELRVALTPVYRSTTASEPTVIWVDQNRRQVATTPAVPDGAGGWKSSLKLEEGHSGEELRPVLEDIEGTILLQRQQKIPALWDDYCLEDEEVIEKESCLTEPERIEISDEQIRALGGTLSGAPQKIAYAPVVFGKISIVGEALQDTTLKAKHSGGIKAQKITYQWLRNGSPISKATGSSYRLTAADRGKQISLRAVASTPGQSSVTQLSGKTAKVLGKLRAPNPRATLAKKIRCPQWNCNAPMKVKITNNSGAKVKYQWYRNGKAIKGATKSTYTKHYKYSKNAKHKVKYTVRVIVSKPGFRTEKQYSTSTVHGWVLLPR